jgi:hypothetical protein
MGVVVTGGATRDDFFHAPLLPRRLAVEVAFSERDPFLFCWHRRTDFPRKTRQGEVFSALQVPI